MKIEKAHVTISDCMWHYLDRDRTAAFPEKWPVNSQVVRGRGDIQRKELHTEEREKEPH